MYESVFRLVLVVINLWHFFGEILLPFLLKPLFVGLAFAVPWFHAAAFWLIWFQHVQFAVLVAGQPLSVLLIWPWYFGSILIELLSAALTKSYLALRMDASVLYGLKLFKLSAILIGHSFFQASGDDVSVHLLLVIFRPQLHLVTDTLLHMLLVIHCFYLINAMFLTIWHVWAVNALVFGMMQLHFIHTYFSESLLLLLVLAFEPLLVALLLGFVNRQAEFWFHNLQLGRVNFFVCFLIF